MMNLAEIGGVLAAGSTTSLAIWKGVIAPKIRKRKLKEQEEIKEEKKEQAIIYKKIEDIHKEMQMDGNGSLKTAVVNLKLGQDQVICRLDDIEENQKAAMNLQGTAFWINDVKGEFTFVSANLCRLMNRSESELIGNNWLAWIVPEDRVRITEAWNFSVENRSAFDEVFHVKKANGSIIKVWSTAFPKIIKKNVAGTLGKMVVIEETK